MLRAMDPPYPCPMIAGRPGCPPFGGGRPIDSGVLVTGMVLRFVSLLVVVALVAWLISRLLNTWTHRRPPTSPLAELDLAYARGILTREDYFTRRADLAAGAVPPQRGSPPASSPSPEPPGSGLGGS